MATHDYNLANASGASFRADLNNALQAVLTNNSSASAPSTTAAYMFWADTNTGILKIRNSANDAWVELLQLDGTLTLEDGSASAVALGFRDELNTGVFSSGAGNFDVSIAGTTRLNISASGINITGTVTDDGATHDGDVTFTGASANVVFDKSDNALEFADNAKLKFGNSGDLEISHDGSNSIINDAGTGEFQIRRAGETFLTLDTNGIRFTDSSGAAIATIRASDAGSAILMLQADNNDDNGDEWRIVNAASDNDLVFQNTSTGSLGQKWGISKDGDVVQLGALVVGGTINSASDNSHDLGTASLRFDDVFATNGTINTSDQNQKNTIATSDLGLDFINRLNPVSYKFNGKTRTHYGLIAQEIETVLSAISKPATDFAGFCKDETDKDGNSITPLYGLRYTEFIAPMIKALQELSAKVTALEGS
jgi:hypothetical protein|tara:strand:- start:899 stop:2173 length:1275 start_codon:yes stop_codon:yes gene_type:complete